jgi:hypothetical protein
MIEQPVASMKQGKIEDLQRSDLLAAKRDGVCNPVLNV